MTCGLTNGSYLALSAVQSRKMEVNRAQVKVPYLVMLKNQTLDMVLFTIDVRNRLCYHMVQALQRAEE